MKTDSEQLIDELIDRVKANDGVSDLANSELATDYIELFQTLNDMPKAKIPVANFERVKSQVLDRIAIPVEKEATTSWGIFLQTLPRVLRITGGVIGSFMILISVTVGTAVAALQSVPGQPIYPFKKVVENVQWRLASNEVEKTNLEIKFANNRLEELEKVLEQSKQGKVSEEKVQKLVEDTVKKINDTAASVAQKSTTSQTQPQVQILTKLVDLSNKQTALLETATIQSEGQIKIEFEKALEASKISQEQAIENIEKAGLKVEAKPIVIEEEPDYVEAKGKITIINSTSISVGTAKFLLTKNTKFVNINQKDLAVDKVVKIKGETVDQKTVALEITYEAPVAEEENPQPEEEPNQSPTEPEETPTNTESGQ